MALAPELGDARLLHMQDLTEDQADEIRDVAGMGMRFVGDFDSNGQSELALFGQNENGDGTFVLLATRQAGAWVRSDLLQFQQTFIVGRLYDNVLMVFFCVGCDHGGRLERVDATYEFVPFPPAGVTD